MKNFFIPTLLCILFVGMGPLFLCSQTVIVPGEGLTTSSIRVNSGDIIAFEARGEVKPGVFVPATGPDGILGYGSYSIIDDISHGALLARVQGSNKWQPIGAKGVLVADKEGKVQFTVNDVERDNNSGSFSVKRTTLNNKWLTELPDCPCSAPSVGNTTDGWAKDIGDLNKYHPGATICFRSYPAKKTSEGNSGQQCCYDSNGALITGGAGAGTPDKESSCDGENGTGTMTTWVTNVPFHYIRDVVPYNNMPLFRYLGLWKPNNDNGCRVNTTNP